MASPVKMWEELKDDKLQIYPIIWRGQLIYYYLYWDEATYVRQGGAIFSRETSLGAINKRCQGASHS